MSAKMLQTFLALLRKQQVQASTIVSFLESDENTSVLGLDSLIGNLKSYGSENLPEDIVKIMIKKVELVIIQKKDQSEEKMNRSIVENSLTNYSEDVTAAPFDINDRTIINSYMGQEDGTTLEYYVLHCPTEASTFKLGDLVINVIPVNSIPFTDRDGTQKSVSYEYRLDITHSYDPVGVEKEFARIKLEVLYNIIGMSFLKSSDTKIHKSTQLITININTATYFKNLASSYDVYFNNLKRTDGVKLSEVPGIENCQIDSNGLILVPQLFYYSSIYTDSDLGGRPYVWSPNKGLGPMDLFMNKYRFTINPGREATKSDIADAMVSFCARLAEVGINVSANTPREDSNSKSISLSINDYLNYSEDNNTYQSGFSAKFNLESKLSAALRKLVRLNFLSSNFYLTNNTRGGAGTEGYTFVYNRNTKTIEASYAHSNNKFMVFFNRSAITCTADEDGNPTKLVKGIIDRNAAKANYTGLMIDTLDNNNQLLPYEGQGYPSVPSDFLPISFMPILFEKNERKNGIFVKNTYLGVSFIPFGFVKNVSTDMNVSTADSAFAIYGSDISLTPVKVRRILKLSNRPDKITNIFQIVIESTSEPSFVGDQPLLTTRLDDTHFLSLFRSTAKVTPATEVSWVYASSYMETLKYDTEISDNTTSLSMFINPGNEIMISKRAILRYATESLGSESEFTNVILDNVDVIFGNDDSIDLATFCRIFTSSAEDPRVTDTGRHQRLSVSNIPMKFFSLLEIAANQGLVNESIVASIMGMLELDDISLISFIRSIQVPVRKNDYPVFSTTMQIAVSNAMNKEIENIMTEMRTINDVITGKTESQIINIASGFSGSIRSVIEMIGREIGEVVSTPTSALEAKNTVLGIIELSKKKPILPDMVGRQIDINFLKEATRLLSSETFVKFIKIVNAELNVESYEDLIKTFLKRETDWNSDFVITTISPYRYTVTFDSSLRDEILNLSGESLPEIGYEVLISDEKVTSYEFGKQIYDHNIHAMFELDPLIANEIVDGVPGLYSKNNGRSVNDIIADTLQASTIYYTQLDGKHLKTDLSIVSLYSIPESPEDTIQFFLPYSYNGARLTVDRTEWSSELANFKLLTKTVEIEFTSEISSPELVREACFDIVNMNTENNNSIMSVIMCTVPVSKPYKREGVESHFFFTSDVSPQLISGGYSPSDVKSSNVISQIVLSKFIGDEVEINIYPINPSIVAHSLISFNDDELLIIINGYGKNHKGKVSLKPRAYLKLYKELNADKTIFNDQFISYGNIRSTLLITRNKRGIYTTTLGNLDTEARIAKGNVPFNPHRAVVNMSDVDELTQLNGDELRSIEERILQSQIDLENSKRDEQNVKHNLGLILSTIRWNTKHVENYRFISGEVPKWIRFSKDSYFMAIAFHSGVKMYIASGDQYVFCTNLPHEGVSEIVFGNNSMCVTTQYQNSDKPFSKLWHATTGNLFTEKLEYYSLTDGDAANIKYITGSTNKTKKNQIISVKDGKIFYGDIQVQLAVPIFNHNVYFFSPDDKYLIWNKKGTFSVLNLETNQHIKFESVNGITTDVNQLRIPIRGIETGVWVNNNLFMGFSYNENQPNIRTRVILDIDKRAIVKTDLIPDFPTMTSAESMIVDSHTKTHPLFTHLIAEKEKYTDLRTGKVGQDGIWLWDLYISLTQKEMNIERNILDKIVGEPDKMIVSWINFHTTDGLYSSYRLTDVNIPTFIGGKTGVDIDGQSIPDYLTTILKIMVVDSIEDETGEHIQKISWLDRNLFDRSRCERNNDMILQCIDENYFAFQGSSIYIWNYRKSLERKWTELSHIGSDGYQRMSFEGHHIAILIGSLTNAAIISGDGIQVRPINLNDDLVFGNKPSDVSAIVKPIKEKYETDFFVNTEVTFESYTIGDLPNPVTLDTRTISSAMCLNRFTDYTTKAHRDSNNDNVFTHDNLSIICHGNVVKIIPRTVPVANKLDGLTSEWYKEQKEDNVEYWNIKKKTINAYILGAEEIFPSIVNKTKTVLKKNTSGECVIDNINMVFVKQIMNTRNANNFHKGLRELSYSRFNMPDITNEYIAYTIGLMQQIFDIFGNVNHITDGDNIVASVQDFWDFPLSSKFFATKMRAIPEDQRRQKYDEYISILKQYVGDKFLTYNAGVAFIKIREIYSLRGIGGRSIFRSIIEINKIIDTQEAAVISNPVDNINNLEIIKIMRYILSIPYIKLSGVQVTKLSDYVSRLMVLKDELRRVESMAERNTKYDLFHAMEKQQLEAKFYEFLLKKLSITSKVNESHVKTDYYNCLTAKYIKIAKPEFMTFGEKSYIIDGKFVYLNTYGNSTHVPGSDSDLERIDEIKNEISDHEDIIENIAASGINGAMKAIEGKRALIRILKNELDTIIKKNDENFIYTDGDEVNMIDLETFNVLNMKNIIKEVYNVVYTFLKEKAFNILKAGFTITTILGIIDKRTIKKDEKEISGYAKQFNQYIKDNLYSLYQPSDIDLALNDFVKTLIGIFSGIKIFPNVDSLYDIIVEVFNKRFPDSLYSLYDEIPVRMVEILDMCEEKIPKDSDPDMLEINIPHIDEFYKFYSDSLKKGYYTNDNSYTRKMDEVKKRLVPMLWKYRQGVCNDVVPVIGFKLTFKNPVTFEPTLSHKQREADDLVFKYKMDEDKVKHGEKYGDIKVNLIDIISNFEDRTNSKYVNSPPGITVFEFSSEFKDEEVKIPVEMYNSPDEYEIFKEPKQSDLLNTEIVSNEIINKKFITEMLMRSDGSSNLSDRMKVINGYDAIEGITICCDTFRDAVSRGLISESKALSLISRDLPHIDSMLDSTNGRISIESIDQYIDLLKGTYRMVKFDRNYSSNNNTSTKMIEGSYNSRPQYVTMDIPLSYKFNYLRPGLEFDRLDISMIYEEKLSDIVDETVDLSRRNISIGNVKPYFYESKLLLDDNEKPYIYKDATDDAYIIWYGNTIVGELPRAYIVTQKLSDRSMKTYHYVKFRTGNNKRIQEESHAMKLFFNYKNKENEEEKKEPLKTYINYMKVDTNGVLIYSEKVHDRKYVRGSGYEDTEIDLVTESHIVNILNNWELHPDIDEKKFSGLQIISHMTKTHSNRTITVSNYRTGRHTGSIVEVFIVEDDKFLCVANWNFYGIDIKNFDFNDTDLFLVGSVAAVDGVNVRIGSMDLNKRIPEKKPIFMNVFDREVSLLNGSIVDLMSVSIDTKDTTFITYDDGKTSHLVIINGKTSYEKKFKNEKMGIIKSMSSSLKNGYVALYFGDIDRTEVWNCDGSLYNVYDGECNWM